MHSRTHPKWVEPRVRIGRHQDDRSIQVYSAFWYLAYHALFFLDLYLSGGLDHWTPGSLRPHRSGLMNTRRECCPKGVYTRMELEVYLAHERTECQRTIEALTDEPGRRACR